MNKRSCQNCLFTDQCPSNHPCRHYAPTDELGEDDSELIETGRARFYREWEAYLADEEASDF